MSHSGEQPITSSPSPTLNKIDGPLDGAFGDGYIGDPATLEKKAQYVMPEIPDGGLTAWATVLGAWLVLFATFGYANAFGVYQDYYTRIYMTNKTSSEIAWIGSTQVCLQFVMGLVSGKLFDSGHFHATALNDSQFIYVISGQAKSLLPSLLTPGHWGGDKLWLDIPSIRWGNLASLRKTPFSRNGDRDHGLLRSGFAWGVRASAFVVLACLIAGNLLMRTRLPPKSKRPPTPPPDIKAIVTDSVYLLAIAGAFLVLLGLFFPIFYTQLFAIVHGLDKNLAFYSLAILNAASVLGRTIPNFIADKHGPFNLLIPCSAISGVLIFAMFGIKSSGALIVFSILYGFFSGAYISLVIPLVASLARDISEIGIRLGIGFAVNGIAALTGTPIAGALLTEELKWWRPITFGGVVILAGTVVLVVARDMQVKHKGNQRV
ncbi:major facilitator superfamily transporter [Ceratobasidium sp. AG-Ba]|nr:major facilitator superfamily transporter [Ceratobasidium sp. AG-Ba]